MLVFRVRDNRFSSIGSDKLLKGMDYLIIISWNSQTIGSGTPERRIYRCLLKGMDYLIIISWNIHSVGSGSPK